MGDTKGSIIIGSDHAAYGLKEQIKKYVSKTFGAVVMDAGTHSEESVDYVDYGATVARAVSEGEYERGILICGTGIGMSITANRFANVRAALCNDLFSAKMSKKHNNANILVMGGRVIGDVLAFEIVNEWFTTEFEGGRHQDRLDKLDHIL